MNDDVDLVGMADVIRTALRRRTSDTHLVEDVTQEAMLRVAVAQSHLDTSVLRAYAIVTARNILVGHARKEAVARRHAHRVVDYTSLRGGEELALEREETNALALALDGLDDADRQLLLDHEVDDISVAVLAARDHTSPGAIAMRLARARSGLRLDFLLAFRRVQLPTSWCRPILLAMSAGDKRRQVALAAPAHLLECPTCAALSEPLVTRRRGAAGWWTFPTPVWMWLRRLGRNRAAQATVAVAVAVAVAATAWAAGGHPGAAPSAAAAPATTHAAISSVVETTINVPPTAAVVAQHASTATTTPATTTVAPTAAPAQAACPPAATALPTTAQPGCAYTVTGAVVTDVSADEGFWIQLADGRPMWTHLVGAGESPEHIHVGDTLTLHATATATTDTATSGIPSTQIARLTQIPVYLSVAYADVNRTARNASTN